MEHDKRALFADGTKDYRNPMEPNIGDRLTLRFRTAKGSAKQVRLCICGQVKRKMLLADTDEWFDLRAEFDHTAATYDVYLNNVRKVSFYRYQFEFLNKKDSFLRIQFVSQYNIHHHLKL